MTESGERSHACDSARARLLAGEPAREHVAAGCAECRSFSQRLARLDAALLGGDPRDLPSVSVVRPVLLRIAASASRRHRRLLAAGLTATAATGGLVVGTAAWALSSLGIGERVAVAGSEAGAALAQLMPLPASSASGLVALDPVLVIALLTAAALVGLMRVLAVEV